MRKLVIGSNSFSGASYIASLLEAGEDVVGVSRSQEPRQYFLPYKEVASGHFEFHQVDLNKDLEKLQALISKERFDTIVNFAKHGSRELGLSRSLVSNKCFIHN